MGTKITYHCLGCGRQWITEDVYPDNQWLCTDCRKKKIPIQMTCSVCGTKFPMQFGTYLLKRSKNPIWRCRRCNDDYRNQCFQNKTPEQRAAFTAKQQENMKRYYESMTAEEKAKNKLNRSKGWDKRREEGTADHALEAMKIGRAEWYNSLSDKEKIAYWKIREDGRSKWWNGLTKPEQDAHMSIAHKAISTWLQGKTDDELIEHFSNLRLGNQKYWEEMTPEKYREQCIETALSLKEMKDMYPDMIPMKKLTDTELEFSNMLKSFKLPYTSQYPSVKIHPDFTKVFSKNPLTGSDRINPSHLWDFLIRTESENVLIDIDGSVHSNSDAIKFNDTKRPYQTDGLRAYIIKCPNDKLSKDNKVINIKNGSEMEVDQLFALLSILNDKKFAYRDN